MKCIFTCCLFFFSCAFLSAQLPPWNAKFVVYHPDGYTDTLWVGCDENATNGYDEGLDSLDNSFEYPISIGAFSPEVDAEFGLDNCVNLKRDIRPFGYPTEFTFYIVHDELETLEYAMIGWDTLEFVYQYENLRLEGCTFRSSYGYIGAIDGIEYAFVGSHVGTDSLYTYAPQPISLIPESSVFQCNPFDFVIKLKLEVYFKDYTQSVNSLNINNQISIFPNPINENLNIINNLYEEITFLLYDLVGNKVFYKQFNSSNSIILDLHELPSGSYFLLAKDKNEHIITSQIIFKL